jgi:hypothetical protein
VGVGEYVDNQFKEVLLRFIIFLTVGKIDINKRGLTMMSLTASASISRAQRMKKNSASEDRKGVL